MPSTTSALRDSTLAVSVIVPVRNGERTLVRCIAALISQLSEDDEIIVVDDASTENVADAIAGFPRVVVHRLTHHAGVAAARNLGAALTSAPLLLFVDADVVVKPDTLARGRGWMADPSIDAVVGSYDDAPTEPGVVSRFKNLSHHYFHQRSAGHVSSFWGACGFVRRETFVDAGGFDAQRFVQPSIEDVELGWRMTDSGAHIVLDPQLQVTHLKRWTLTSLVVTDVVYRAIPWARCSRQRGVLPAELNVSRGQRMVALLAIAWMLTGVSALAIDGARWPFVAISGLALAANWRLFSLLWRHGGPRLLIAGFLLQKLYYLCAVAGFSAGVLLHYAPGRRRVTAPAAALTPPRF